MSYPVHGNTNRLSRRLVNWSEVQPTRVHFKNALWALKRTCQFPHVTSLSWHADENSVPNSKLRVPLKLVINNTVSVAFELSGHSPELSSRQNPFRGSGPTCSRLSPSTADHEGMTKVFLLGDGGPGRIKEEGRITMATNYFFYQQLCNCRCCMTFGCVDIRSLGEVVNENYCILVSSLGIRQLEYVHSHHIKGAAEMYRGESRSDWLAHILCGTLGASPTTYAGPCAFQATNNVR